MWTICPTCGAVVADQALHAATHKKSQLKITRPSTPRPRLESHYGH